jgi:tetratricopeptide (TPR) repeat protein
MQYNTEKVKNLFNKSDEQIIERILTLKQILQENRASPVDYHDLAIHYFFLKNYDKTIHTINELLKRFPDYIDLNRALKLKIIAQIYLKQYDAAIKEILNRLKINPQDVILLSCLAHCFEKKNQFQKALQIHRKILDIEPNRASSLNSYAYLLTLYGPKEFLNTAEVYIKRALKINPNNPAYLDTYGVFLNKIGKKDLAKQYLLKALQLDPKNVVIIMHLKDILKEKKESIK